MSHTHKLAQAGIVTMALGALVASGTGISNADPTTPGTYRTYAAVGSDTTQSVWNGLSNGSTPAVTGVASYDAVGSDTIKTKSAGATFTRPVGSGNGVKALSAVWDPSYTSHDFMGTALTHDEVDFARSSSGPVSGSGLTYLPFARDAVSVAIKPYTTGTSITNFTTAQLAAIYGGPDDNVAGTGVTYDANTTYPVVSGHILHPFLPQSGSGTRKFFQGAINIPDTDLAAYVDPASSLIENDGTALTTQGDLIPFSAAQWIAQVNGKQTNTTAGDKLLNTNSKTPFSGTAPNLVAGTLYGTKNSSGTYSTPPATGVGVFARDTYDVVPTAFLTGTTTQKTLVTRLTGTATGTVGSSASKTIIKKFGFGLLAYVGNSADYLSGAFQH